MLNYLKTDFPFQTWNSEYLEQTYWKYHPTPDYYADYPKKGMFIEEIGWPKILQRYHWLKVDVENETNLFIKSQMYGVRNSHVPDFTQEADCWNPPV